MREIRKFFWPSLLGVALVQIAVLGRIVWDRHTLIQHGREIVMQVTPVDPRDIFRGDYVILGYPMSRMEYTGEKFGALSAGLAKGDEVYVTMTPGSDDAWSVAKVSASYPKETAANDAVLKGRVDWIDEHAGPNKASVRARFGIESYFVPEGEGKVLEDKVRVGAIKAVIALGPDGTSALKGLVVGGERRIDPPLF